jgi:hypothetical protein
MSAKPTVIKFNDKWKVGANRFALPLPNNFHNFSCHALKLKGLVAVIGVMVDNNRFFDSNAITNVHSL